MPPRACLNGIHCVLRKGFPTDGRSQQWETPTSGPVNALLWGSPRLIIISLLPSVSVLAVLFPLVLVEKDLIVKNLKASFSISTACSWRSHCWDHRSA